MASKTTTTKETVDLVTRLSTLEQKVTKLEKLSNRAPRKKREYTEEQRNAIRARLLAGQEVARKKHMDEAKHAKKNKVDNSEKPNTLEAE
jgi:hypothetical protein